jgi:hypothetical protein
MTRPFPTTHFRFFSTYFDMCDTRSRQNQLHDQREQHRMRLEEIQ